MNFNVNTGAVQTNQRNNKIWMNNGKYFNQATPWIIYMMIHYDDHCIGFVFLHVEMNDDISVPVAYVRTALD